MRHHPLGQSANFANYFFSISSTLDTGIRRAPEGMRGLPISIPASHLALSRSQVSVASILRPLRSRVEVDPRCCHTGTRSLGCSISRNHRLVTVGVHSKGAKRRCGCAAKSGCKCPRQPFWQLFRCKTDRTFAKYHLVLLDIFGIEPAVAGGKYHDPEARHEYRQG